MSDATDQPEIEIFEFFGPLLKPAIRGGLQRFLESGRCPMSAFGAAGTCDCSEINDALCNQPCSREGRLTFEVFEVGVS
jgi:hypothetical protein